MVEHLRSVRFWIAVALAPLAPAACAEAWELAVTHAWNTGLWTRGYFLASPWASYFAAMLFGWPAFLILAFVRRLDGLRVVGFGVALGFVLAYGLALIGAFSAFVEDVEIAMVGWCLPTAIAFWLIAGLPWRIPARQSATDDAQSVGYD